MLHAIMFNRVSAEKVSLKLFYILEHFSEIAENLLKLH